MPKPAATGECSMLRGCRELLAAGYCLALWLVLAGGCAVDAHGEEVEGAVFEYGEGPLGPENWGQLHEEWRACGEGRAQSPVDIRKKQAVKGQIGDGALSFHYASGAAHLSIREHDVAVEWREGGGGVLWNEEEYKLLHLHLHTPSEHTINGFKYPLEAHMVHESQKKSLLVVSILYKYGNADTMLSYLMDEFPYLHGSGIVDHHIGNVSLSAMKLGDKFYHYMGSLTTPPCTEGVTWIIMKKKRNVSKEQVDEIVKAELGENARPEQTLNGRLVYRYR